MMTLVKNTEPRDYSPTFKKQVVQAIVSGKMTVHEAQRRYGIGNTATILGWMQVLCKPAIQRPKRQPELQDLQTRLHAAESRIKELERLVTSLTLELRSGSSYSLAPEVISVTDRNFRNMMM